MCPETITWHKCRCRSYLPWDWLSRKCYFNCPSQRKIYYIWQALINNMNQCTQQIQSFRSDTWSCLTWADLPITWSRILTRTYFSVLVPVLLSVMETGHIYAKGARVSLLLLHLNPPLLCYEVAGEKEVHVNQSGWGPIPSVRPTLPDQPLNSQYQQYCPMCYPRAGGR